MRTKKSYWGMVVLCVFMGDAVASPPYINYQGLLNGGNGQPLPTGNYTMDFRIYDTAQGGAPVWGPFLFDGGVAAGHGPVVPVANGHFNVIIGPSDTSSNSIASVFGAANRFIEIRVNGGSPILPRQQFLTTPYAFAVSNSKYELTSDLFRVKTNNAIVFGDLLLPTANGTILSLTSNLTISGAGTNGSSRRITLNGDVLVSGAAAATPSLSVAGDTVLNDFSSSGNGVINGTLQAANLSDGVRTLSMANVLREDPPVTMNLFSLGETTTWQLYQIDLQQYCDDDDGCTIRVHMQHELNYEVRFFDNKIALERSSFSRSGNTNIVRGRTLQLNSNETHAWDRYYTLGDNAREVVWEAWDWSWATDFRPGGRVGGSDDAPHTGNDKFKIWIAMHPHVSAKIIIYDR